MKKLVILFAIINCFGVCHGLGQQRPDSGKKVPVTASRSPGNKPAPGNVRPSPGGSESQGKPDDFFGGDSKDRPKGPTEITATQEAQFDVKTRRGVFIGNVKVVDPQFTLTADRLTVRLNKDEEGGGLNEAQAEGNVIIVHVNQPKAQGQQAAVQPGAKPVAQPAASGQPGAQAQQPIASTGKADKAVYEAKDGSVTLTGWPQVTQGVNTHVAAAPGVKMVLYRDGRMQTYGTTRTLIQDRTGTNNPSTNGAQ